MGLIVITKICIIWMTKKYYLDDCLHPSQLWVSPLQLVLALRGWAPSPGVFFSPGSSPPPHTFALRGCVTPGAPSGLGPPGQKGQSPALRGPGYGSSFPEPEVAPVSDVVGS